MSTQLDPWADASVLAARLARADTKLFVIVGAENWCVKCRELRPQFDSAAAQAGDDEVWLWLDLEDHAEFVGEYMPENLPMLISYRGKQLLDCRHITDPTLRLSARSVPLNPSSPLDPGIRSRLLVQDWAG